MTYYVTDDPRAVAALLMLGLVLAGMAAAAWPRRRFLTATAPTIQDVTSEPVPVAGDPDARTIAAVLVRWNTVGTTSAGPTRFLPGSLETPDDLRRVKYLREHDRNVSMGYAQTVAADADQAVGVFYLPPGDPTADRALAEAANGVRDAVSVGVEVIDADLDQDGVLNVRRALLREVSQVSVAAFPDSVITRVTAHYRTPTERNADTMSATVRTLTASRPTGTTPTPQEATTPEATTPEAATTDAPATGGAVVTASRSDLVAAFRQAMGLPADGSDPDPEEVRRRFVPVPAGQGGPSTVVAGQGGGPSRQEFAQLVASFSHPDGPDGGARALYAALADITPATVGTYNPPTYLRELWEDTEVRRPTFDAYGPAKPVTGQKLIAFKWNVKPKMAAYAGNKAEIPTTTASRSPIEVTPTRTAGGNDIDRILFDLPDEGFIDAYNAAMVDSYRELSNAKLNAFLFADSAPILDGEAGEGVAADFLTGLVQAVIEVAAYGGSPTSVILDPALLAELFGIKKNDAPAFFGGSMKLAGLGDGSGAGDIGGLTFDFDADNPPGGVLVGQRSAVQVWENAVPIKVQALDVAKGGVDVAFYGYHAHAITHHGRVRHFTVDPTP